MNGSKMQCPKRMRRAYLLLGGMLAWAAVCSGHGSATYTDMLRAKQSGAPNIILVAADGLGCGDLGCYGSKAARSPNVDRLASEGLRFTQAYGAAADFAVSQAVLLTGKAASQWKNRDASKGLLTAGDSTLAEVLQAAGYRTGAIGAWQLGTTNTAGLPWRQGFDEWFGSLDPRCSRELYPDHLWRNERRLPLPGNAGGKKGFYSPEAFTKAALNFIRSYRNFPFFLYLAHPIPHSDSQRVADLDASLGRLVQLLQELKLDECTLVWVTSVQPPPPGSPGEADSRRRTAGLRGAAGDLYEGGIRVPFLVHWKSRIPAGVVREDLLSLADVAPTLAELAQTSMPRQSNGLSVAGWLLGSGGTNRHEFLCWEGPGDGHAQAIREGEWKVVRHSTNQPVELYQLRLDPGEATNVATLHPDRVAALTARVREAELGRLLEDRQPAPGH